MPIWPVENGWEGSTNAGEEGSRGSDTREVWAYPDTAGTLVVGLFLGVDK